MLVHSAVTPLLHELRSGDRSALDRVVALLYRELRGIAHRQLGAEPAERILQPTALVNEAYLRLAGHRAHNWQNRAHFMGAAAQAMRRILVEQARRRRAQKRSWENAVPVKEEALAAPSADSTDVLAIDNALRELEQVSQRQHRVVELRHFGGLTVPEVAVVLGVTTRTVDRDWAIARAWLRRRLRQ